MDKVDKAFEALCERLDSVLDYDIHQEIDEISTQFNLDWEEQKELLEMYDDLPLRW